MTEIIEAILASPVIRSFIEGIAIKIVSDVLHRRSVDPSFLASSDLAFSQLSSAQTEQEQQDALLKVQQLLSSG